MSRSNTRTAVGITAALGLAFGAGYFISGTSQTTAASPQDARDRVNELRNDVRDRLAGDAQDAGGSDAALPDDMMAAWAAVSEPGEYHEHLNAFIGEWEVNVKMWMEPGSTPMTSAGTARRRWVLGGRFVQERINAESPFGDGEFEALSYVGYNNIDKQYEMIWMENMSTAMASSHGVYDSTSNVMRMFGQHRMPDGSVMTTWSDTDISNPSRHTMTGWAIGPDGAPFKHFEGVFEKVN